MPVKWTPELDSILLHGVFEECNISFSKTLCTKIAERVTAAGMECTPKAIEGRLYSWKKKNVSGNSGLSSTTSTPAKKTATATGTPKTPRPRAKATPKKKNKLLDIDEALDGDGDDDDDEDVKSPSAAAGKRGARKASYVEKEDEDEEDGDGKFGMHVSKKVKKEPVEEDFLDGDAEGEEV